MFKNLLRREEPAPTEDVHPEDEVQEEQPRKVSHAIAEIEQVGSTVVATLTVTELTDDHGSAPLAGLLEELSQLEAKHIVLDLQNVQFMDSACLGCLVETLNSLNETGGRIALASAEHAVKSLFRLTRLDRLFPFCQDVMSAINAVECPNED